MSRARCHLVPGACALALLVPFTAAPASTLSWAAAASGFASAAANWNPAAVPTGSDLLRFDVGPGLYTVTFDAAVPASVSHDYRRGLVLISCASPHDIATQLTAGSGAGQVVTARLNSGTLTSGWSMLVGTGSGADGTLQVLGSSAHMIQHTGPGAPVLSVGGALGKGTMRVAAGGIFEAGRSVNLGQHAGSLGILRVVGEATGTGAHASQFLADHGAADLRVGDDGAHGVAEITGGGYTRFARDLIMAAGAGDSAEVTIATKGTLDSSRVEIQDDLSLSANFTGGAAAGWSHLTLDEGGVLSVADSSVFGDPDGSSVTFDMHKGSRFSTGSLVLQQAGLLDGITGGTLQVLGGTLVPSAGGFRLPGGIDGPKLELHSGATASVSTTPGVPAAIVGDASYATLNLFNGSSFTASGGRVVLGSQAGSSGTLFMYQDAAFTSAARTIVGDTGAGGLYAWYGSTVTTDGLDVGRAAGGDGHVRSSLGDSRITVTDLLNVGGSANGPGGAGVVEAALEGTIDLQRAGLSGTVWPGGELYVNEGGTVNLTADLDVSGTLRMGGGTLNGGAVSLLPGGTLTGHGAVVSALTTGTDTSTVIHADGDLTFGSGLSFHSFVNRGRLEVGDHLVTIYAASPTDLGNVTLDGGELRITGGSSLESGKRLTGTGTITGNLFNQGDIVASGPTGIQIAGLLSNAGSGVGGSRIRFLSTASFAGGGHLDLPVTTDAGSRIVPGAELVMGQAGVLDALDLHGVLQVLDQQRVELRSGNDVTLHGTEALFGGTLDLAGGGAALTIDAGGALVGRGTIGAPLVVAGSVSADSVGLPINVTGTLQLTSSARMSVQVGKLSLARFSRIVATGPLVLSGTLDVEFLPSYLQAGVDSIQVIAGASRTGTFTTLLYKGQPVTGEYAVHYSADGAWVILTGSTVDVSDEPVADVSPRTIGFAALGSPGTHADLELALPGDAQVRLDVYDVWGRRVATLIDRALAAGRHRFAASPSGLAAGVYYARASIRGASGLETRTLRFVQLR